MSEFQKNRMRSIRKKINEEWNEEYMKFIEKYPKKSWSWFCISQNANLSMEMIEKHPEKPWDWQNISLNSFKKDKEKFIEKKYKEHLSAFRIQQHWFKAKINPNYLLCKKMVNDFYDRTIMARYM